jgi:hypothetical protein
MAIQKGIIKIKGTVGDTTFLETKDGNQVREKSRLSAAQIKSSPAFARTRENNSEFGRAGIAGKLMRDSISTLLSTAKGPNTIGRLVKRMMLVLKQDFTSSRGKRNVMDGPLTNLVNFEFNVNAVRNNIVLAEVTSTIDRVAGHLTVNVASFVPEFGIKAPAGTTHFKLVSAGAELDFEQVLYKRDVKLSANIAWDRTATAPMTILHTLTPNSTLPLFIVFGVQFFQQVGPDMNPLLEGGSNVLTIINVSKP